MATLLHMGFRSYVEQWLCSLECRLATDSILQYGWTSRTWRWRKPSDITPKAVAEYQQRRLKEVTRETVRKNCVALQSFIDWCALQGLMTRFTINQLSPLIMGTRAVTRPPREPISPTDMWKVIDALPTHAPNGTIIRDYFIVLWETALRPITVQALRTGLHYPHQAAKYLLIPPELDKARNRSRRKADQPYAKVPITDECAYALTRAWPGNHELFGRADRSKYLSAAGLKAIGRNVQEYDFKHSRITSWFSEGKDPMAISYLTGVNLKTLLDHYAHPGEAAAARMIGQ